MKTDTHGYDVAIDVSHHLIHHGKMFSISDVDLSVDIAGPKYWRIHTPAGKFVHVSIKLSASAGAIARIYRAPTVSAAGTALAVINRNENSLNVAESTAFYDTTVSGEGVLLELYRIGSGTNPAGMSPGGDRGDELELLPDTDYNMKVTTEANGTSVELHINLYEEDD